MRTVTLESGTFEVLEVIRKTQYKCVALARCAQTGDKVILRTQRQDSEAYPLLTAVRSPHLARVLSVQRTDGLTCVVEEYVRGSLLSDVLDRGRVSSAQALSIAIQLCDALEALHSAGIVHRDVKPENIMLQPDGSVKLFDYDAARVYNVLAGRDTTLMGTVGYAAPEQFGLTQSDARSDIYSLGVLLNLMLTDAHPTVRLCRGALRPIVLRCTHVNPERRYQSVRSVRRRLTLVQHRGKLLTCAAVTAAALLLLTATAFHQNKPAPSPTPTPTPTATPTPSPTPTPTISAGLPMPMRFTDQTRSVQTYALDGVNYTLIISVDEGEMYAPDIKSNTRHFYLPEYETTPLFVYVVPEDGSAESIRRFKAAAASVTCSVQPQTGEVAPIAPRNFGDTLYDDTSMLASGMLCADAATGMEPRHCMATARIAMKNGDAITLNYSVTQIPAEVTLDAARYPMSTAEQLNRLLGTLDMAYGWNANVSVTLRLPETVYTEEIVLRGRAVSLQGAPGGTILAAGLRVTAADDAPIALRGLTFRGDGSGSAITSARDVTAIDCTFTQYDDAFRAIDGAQFSSRGCTFDLVEPPIPANAAIVPTTFRYDASQTGLAIGGDDLNIPGQGDGSLTIYLTGDEGLTQQQAESVAVTVDNELVTLRTSAVRIAGGDYVVRIDIDCGNAPLRIDFALNAASPDGSIAHALDCSYGKVEEGVYFEGETRPTGFRELPPGTEQAVVCYRGTEGQGISAGWQTRLLKTPGYVTLNAEELPYGAGGKNQLRLTLTNTIPSREAPVVCGLFDTDGVLRATFFVVFTQQD